MVKSEIEAAVRQAHGEDVTNIDIGQESCPNGIATRRVKVWLVGSNSPLRYTASAKPNGGVNFDPALPEFELEEKAS